MIQLNLLPDVKLAYIKAERTRRAVLSAAVIITAAAIGILIITFVVGAAQKKHINDLNDDIKTYTAELEEKKDVEKILTVQNQLETLSELHSSKPAAANLFGYLNQVTPPSISINDFTIDFTVQTMTITGTSDALSSVNKYIDTLKYTKFSSEGDETQKNAFSDVVLSSFSLNTGSGNPRQAANYTITMAYDPAIFDIADPVTLTVPKLTTTRAALDSTSDLFTTSPAGGAQ